MKKIIWIAGIGLALTLTACGNNNSTTPNTVTVDKVVEIDPSSVLNTNTSPLNELGLGTLGSNLVPKAWSSGAGNLQGYIGSDTTQAAIAQGILNADGTFTLNLPDTVVNQEPDDTLSSELLFTNQEFTCTQNTIVASDTHAQFDPLYITATAAGKTTPIFNMNIKTDSTGKTTGSQGLYVYTDRAWTLQGTAECTNPSTGVVYHANYNANFVKGWNKLAITAVETKTATGYDLKETITTGAFPTNLWYALPDTSATTLSLKAKHN